MSNATSIQLSCLHCYEKATYKPAAMHLTLLSTGVAILAFFCTSCRRENRQEVGPDIGERLQEEGVPLELVNVPLEFEERMSSPEPGELTPAIVAALEDMSHEVFERVIRREFGMDRSG